MRKTNKVLSLTVAGLMAFSTSAVTAFSVSAAEDVTDTKIYFEVPTEIWADALVKTDVSALKFTLIHMQLPETLIIRKRHGRQRVRSVNMSVATSIRTILMQNIKERLKMVRIM